MLKRSPLKRYTPLRAKRNKAQVRIGKVSGKVRLSGAALEALREKRYRIDRGICQWRKDEPDACGKWLPLYGSVFTRGHLAHVLGRGAGGSDTVENTRILCFTHHIESEHTKGLKG